MQGQGGTSSMQGQGGATSADQVLRQLEQLEARLEILKKAVPFQQGLVDRGEDLVAKCTEKYFKLLEESLK